MRRVTLSTDRGLVGLSAVQVEVWFSVDQDSFVDPQRSNDNGNGGEAL